MLAEAVAVTGLPEDELLAPIAPALPATLAELVFGVTHEGAATVEDLLDRRTRIGLVPEDRELAGPAAERALALATEARAWRARRAPPSPRRQRADRSALRPGCRRLPVVAGDEQAVAEVDLATEDQRRTRRRPGGRVRVAVDQVPGARVGAEDLGQLGTHLGLGLEADDLARHGTEHAATRCCPGGA